ncbi:MAG: MraY family glycosyltransferase [Candidatus Eisenbacteria bacterium]|nr:MraY family glycosyltransferase [Candidatus Eisenbacteria bacterium]
MPHLVTFLLSLLLSFILTPVFRTISRRLSFVDLPEERKFHSKATPLLGGIAVFLAWQLSVLVGLVMLDGRIDGNALAIFGGALVVIVVGLIDDRRGMSPLVKLGGQAAAAAILLLGGGVGRVAGHEVVNFLISLIWAVGLMNALNFLDNMDGISGGVSFLAGLFFFLLSTVSGEGLPAVLAAGLCGATLGFLRYNFSPASIFLGDAGSLFLGYCLCALSLGAIPNEMSGLKLFVPVLVLGYPVFDITFVTVIRLLEGRKIYQGGKDHSSHRMVTVLGSVPKGCLVIYSMSVVLGLTGFIVYNTAFTMPFVARGLFAATGVLMVLLGLVLSRVKQ